MLENQHGGHCYRCGQSRRKPVLCLLRSHPVSELALAYTAVCMVPSSTLAASTMLLSLSSLMARAAAQPVERTPDALASAVRQATCGPWCR